MLYNFHSSMYQKGGLEQQRPVLAVLICFAPGPSAGDWKVIDPLSPSAGRTRENIAEAVQLLLPRSVQGGVHSVKQCRDLLASVSVRVDLLLQFRHSPLAKELLE